VETRTPGALRVGAFEFLRVDPSKRSAALWALASLAICGSACAARAEQAHRALSQFREDLTLSLTVSSPVVVGEETSLRLRVRNSGRHEIEACLGQSHVSIVPEDDTQGNEPIGISTRSAVNRPGCRQRFRLVPGAHFEWSEALSVPGIVRGFGSLAVDVQIADPRDCDSEQGCLDLLLTASAPIEIR
jgi:hypothetical protein